MFSRIKKYFLIIIISIVSLLMLVSCSQEQPLDDDSSNVIEEETPIKEEIPNNNVVEINMMETKEYSDISLMIEDIKPSVVDIYSYATNTSSAGSGVIVGASSDSYYIVTNHHVIDNSQVFQIVTYNKQGLTTTYEGVLVGTSPKNDIAVLEVKTTDSLTVAAVIEDSNMVKIGTEVIAIGNPLGILGGSVTHGIISATEREVYISDLGYMSLFQTDAAINSGNSGGALFNYNGALIGVVNSGYTNYEGLNFAIPANIMVKCFESIIETKTDTSLGYMLGEADLGMTLSETTIYSDSSLRAQVSVIYVSQIENNSDASKNGVIDYESFVKGKANSFYALSKINGTSISSLNEAIRILDDAESGKEIVLEFIEIAYLKTSGFFGQTAIYLTENVVTITIIPTQYIYVMHK